MKERMPDDVGVKGPPGENETWGPTLLKEFDEDPGENIISKSTIWGKRGFIAGAVAGSFHAGVIEPAANVNGLWYALRHMGTAGVITGASGLVLGAGIPIAQAIRKKNDPWAWAWGGFAAGSVFGLKSGKLGAAIQFGTLLGTIFLVTKTAGSYRDPYPDPNKHLRQPAPKYLKLFDENGDIITYRQR